MGKYFGTDGFRGEAGITLTADHAYKVGRFLGWYYNALRERNGDTDPARIVIGKDTRRSSYMFEYSLVAGVNDGPDDVKELTGILKHRNCHLNLIPVNPIKERDFKKPDSKKAMEFQNKLEKNGINVTIRRERGSDIDGACGQLRRRYGAVKEERPDEDICED